MPKLIVQLVVYNSKTYLNQVFKSVFEQTFKDFIVVAVICGNDDGSKEFIEQYFPDVKILDPGKNLGFGGGHNFAFNKFESDYVQLIGNDLVLEPDYFEKLLSAFSNEKVASAGGKLYKYDFEFFKKSNILDTTGVIIYQNGRARDRGQHEKDTGQYDRLTHLAAVSGAAPMYRRSALKKVAESDGVVFDPEFFMYWEDVDLGLRMLHAGFINLFVPEAVGHHSRGAASSEGGVREFSSFKKHRATQNIFVKRWNYQNHILFVIKNYPDLTFKWIIRELLMFGYVLIFETRTLSILPSIFKALPKVLRKREIILSNSKISPNKFFEYFEKSGNNLS